MAHQPDHLASRHRQLGQPPTAHARVELEMDPDPLRDLAVRDHELEAGVAGICDLPAGGRAHHEDSRSTERLPKRQPFRHRRHAERGRTGPERRGPDVDRAVPVTVRLDDRPELGALESAEERPDVPPDRTQVDDQVGAGHQPDAKGYWIWVSQLASKVSVPGPPMQTSVPPSPRSTVVAAAAEDAVVAVLSAQVGVGRGGADDEVVAVPAVAAPRDEDGHGDPVARRLRLLLIDRDRADIALRARHRHRVRRRERRDQHEPTHRSDRGVACESGRPHRSARRSRAGGGHTIDATGSGACTR